MSCFYFFKIREIRFSIVKKYPMKYYLLYILVTLVSPSLFAQNNTHQTIGSLKVMYKSVPQSTLNTINEMSGIPQASITLNANNNATKIYFKIVNPKTNQIVYEVDYLLNISPVLNNNGFKLYEKNGNNVYISTGQPLGLKPYEYQILTENAQGQKTSVYSAIK